jgi:hypothetical protein
MCVWRPVKSASVRTAKNNKAEVSRADNFFFVKSGPYYYSREREPEGRGVVS